MTDTKKPLTDHPYTIACMPFGANPDVIPVYDVEAAYVVEDGNYTFMKDHLHKIAFAARTDCVVWIRRES